MTIAEFPEEQDYRSVYLCMDSGNFLIVGEPRQGTYIATPTPQDGEKGGENKAEPCISKSHHFFVTEIGDCFDN